MKKIIKKFESASPVIKASMALLITNIVLKGLSLISGPVFTRIMSTEQYGVVSTFQSWQSLLAVIVTLNLNQGVFNNGMLDYKEKRNEFQYALIVITTFFSALFFVIFQIFRKFLIELFEIPVTAIYVMMLYFLFVPAYQFWSGRQRYEYKYKAMTVIALCVGFFSLLFGIVFVLIATDDRAAIARICAMEGVNILVGAFFFVYIAIKARFKIRLDYCRYALKFNIPLVPHYLSMYVLNSSDRIMITKLVDSSATAIYSVSYTVASVIQIFWVSIEASLSPWIYEKLSIKDEESVNKTTIQIVLLFATLCVGCTSFAPEIMAILAPASYRSGIYVIPAVAAGIFFTAVYSLYMRVELFYKKTGFATIASTCAALCNVVLNYYFINRYGFIAAGYTTMLCYALLSLFHYFNVKHNGFQKAINNKLILVISVGVILISIGISLLYSFTIIRYICIGMIVIIVLVKRHTAINILKNIRK